MKKLFLFALFTGLLSINLALATTITEDEKLTISNGTNGDFFGYSADVYGDYMIVGAYGENSSTGSAYIYHQENGSWIQQQKLTASDGTDSDYFGSSVSIYGDYAIIGAHGDENYIGSAYIFHLDNGTWTQQQKLTASDGATNDFFGASVSIYDDNAIVGAYGDNNYTGSAYIFLLDNGTWSESQKLTASDGASGDRYGASVSIYGGWPIVGAYGDDSFTGSVYTYQINWPSTTFVQDQKLIASDGETGDNFGYSVSMTFDYLIVGANEDNDSKGSAYIFQAETYSLVQQQKLIASDAAMNDKFGTSVSVSGDNLIVGAESDDLSKGSAYIFHLEAGIWTRKQKLTASDGAGSDYFGKSVSISGDYAIVGAYGDNSNTGSVYTFTFKNPPILSSTLAASEISHTSIVSGGNITDDNGLSISEKGLCWNTTGMPTQSDNKVSEVNDGSFTNIITGLEPNTTYYIRAFAMNEYQKVAYGDQITFTTYDISIAINSSAKISDTQYSFTSEIHNPDSIEIVDRGIVWSSEEEPTVFDHIGKVRSGDGSEIFTADATGLFASSSFYLRSYITTYQGTYYSASVHFGVVPVLPTWALMLLAGGFVITGGWFVFRKFM